MVVTAKSLYNIHPDSAHTGPAPLPASGRSAFGGASPAITRFGTNFPFFSPITFKYRMSPARRLRASLRLVGP